MCRTFGFRGQKEHLRAATSYAKATAQLKPGIGMKMRIVQNDYPKLKTATIGSDEFFVVSFRRNFLKAVKNTA